MHDSKTIANYFLRLAEERGLSLTPMQLLKLVYIAHGWSLGLNGRPLIRDEIQAWQYGPVIRRLYDAVRQYRDQPITEELPAPVGARLDDEDRALLDSVFEQYGSLSGIRLSRLTHAPGTPWAQTYEPGEFGTPIPNDIIQEHYERLARERR